MFSLGSCLSFRWLRPQASGYLKQTVWDGTDIMRGEIMTIYARLVAYPWGLNSVTIPLSTGVSPLSCPPPHI